MGLLYLLTIITIKINHSYTSEYSPMDRKWEIPGFYTIQAQCRISANMFHQFILGEQTGGNFSHYIFGENVQPPTQDSNRHKWRCNT